MFDKSQAQQLIGQELRTTDGTKIGTVGQVYFDEYHDAPEWVTVNTGLFGSNESFVPLAEGTIAEGALVVPYTKDQIKGAPNISEDGRLTEQEERTLYDHYGVPYTTEGSTFADMGPSGGNVGDAADGQTEPTGTVGHDTSGPTTDYAMTRSEQRLDVGTERVETGKARLRKWIETEEVQVDVPVSREKPVVVTEPITDANIDNALDGPELSEEEHEVTLTEQRAVVSKETVPVERVRLDKDVHTETEQVQETVAKERIALEGDVEASGERRG